MRAFASWRRQGNTRMVSTRFREFVEVAGDDLALTLFTRSGRLLDSLVLPPERLPLRPEEMPRLLEVFVPLVEEVPGR